MPAVHSFIKSLKRPPNVTRKSWSSRVSYLHKRARDFVVEIVLLLTRVRKSFLYDHGGFSAKELEELVTRTGLCNNAGSTPRLIIFLLQESIFVLNVNDIGSIYASFTACEQNPAFVNVARNLKSPSVLPDDHSFVQACREEFQLIITFLTESARACPKKVLFLYSLPLDQDHPLTTGFMVPLQGLILEYPVVFCVADALEYPEGNCLGHEPMYRYQVIVDVASETASLSFPCFSFSSPVNIVNSRIESNVCAILSSFQERIDNAISIFPKTIMDGRVVKSQVSLPSVGI